MTRASNWAWFFGIALGLGVLTLGSTASAQSVPAPPTAAPASPTAETAHGGCPYSTHPGCQCCHHGPGMRIAATATSALLVGAAIAFSVLTVNTGNQVGQMYDARDPNHTLPLGSYADIAALNGQRQTYQDWSIGLYVTGGIFTAMTAFMWIAPLRWRAHARPYAPSVAVGPTSVSFSLAF